MDTTHHHRMAATLHGAPVLHTPTGRMAAWQTLTRDAEHASVLLPAGVSGRPVPTIVPLNALAPAPITAMAWRMGAWKVGA